MRVLLTTFVALSAASPAWAQVAFDNIFNDHAVLQRDMPVKVWGTADANAPVTVNLNGTAVTVTADAKGQWTATLPANKAGGPYTLKATSGSATTALNDVVMGDVWLCSGQSNMEFQTRYATNAYNEIQNSANPDIRFVSVERDAQPMPLESLPQRPRWRKASPETTGDTSAVCYYMAKDLQKTQKVPIGMIQSSWGGTTIQSWMSEPALRDLKPYDHALKAPLRTANADTPASLYNGMVAPIAPYTLKGAAWYQGESNVSQPTEYARLLPALIKDWRTAFEAPDLPFMVVQLANFGSAAPQASPSSWAELREVQRKTVGADPKTGLAVAIDFGDRVDIHPTQKAVVGQRLALAARKVAYGEAIAAGGPQPVKIERMGGDIIITFDTVLKTYSSAQAIGFEVCDAAKICRFTTADVSGQQVTLKAANTPVAKFVRYAWADAPYVNLYSDADLPAIPFESQIN